MWVALLAQRIGSLRVDNYVILTRARPEPAAGERRKATGVYRSMPVVIVGTLDTKGREVAFLRDQLHAQGLATVVIDAGSLGTPSIVADIAREEVFRRAGTELTEIRQRGDRGQAVAKAAEGASAIICDMASQGQVDGVLGL